MLLFCQLLINRDKDHQPNSESPACTQSESCDCSKETGIPSGMCFVNLFKCIKYLKHHINSRTSTRLACEQALHLGERSEPTERGTRERAAKPREAEERRACNDLSQILISTSSRRSEIPLDHLTFSSYDAI